MLAHSCFQFLDHAGKTVIITNFDQFPLLKKPSQKKMLKVLKVKAEF